MMIIIVSMKANNKVFIGLGSNVGDRIAYLNKAIDALEGFVRIVNRSLIYETDQVGYKNQGRFLNMVVEVSTGIDPRKLLKKLKGIEKDLGRKNSEIRFGPREIDLDILLYGKEVVDDEGLKVPHQRMHEREFVLTPLNEISPFTIHPRFNKTINELWTQIKLKN